MPDKKTYYDRTVKSVLKDLETKEKGLSEKEAKKRLEKYGKNKLEEKEKISPVEILLQQFKSPLIWVLIAAMIISIIVVFIEHGTKVGFGNFTEAIVILVILILNAIFGFVQEYKAEKAIEKLRELSSPKCKVIRDGETKEMDAEKLVPGDIIKIETGDRIPADSRIIEESELETQEAALTGESTPVSKTSEKIDSDKGVGDRINCVFAGTVVTKGKGKAVVIQTGMDTETGQIAEMISTSKKSKTPLQNKLAKLGKLLTILVIVISVLVFAIGLLRGYLTGDIDFELVREMLISAIALAVAAIPEGLPAVVTITLALGVRKMVQKNALIRRLPSVETLGATTMICTDKTGTLTHNEMTVKKLFVNEDEIEVEGTGYEAKGGFSKKKNIEKLLEIGALCNNSELKKEKKKWKIIGDPTEGALIVSAKKADIDIDKLGKKYKREDEMGFTSERKRMTTIHKNDDGKGKIAYMKGAPDVVIDLCSKVLINGKEKKLTKKMKKEIIKQNEEFADDALRVLSFAYKKLGKKYSKKKLEKSFVFVGLQAMIDPPRKEVKDSIKECKEAGIGVIIVTGDHKNTAVAIGKQLGIEGKAVEGKDLEKMSKKKLKKEISDIAVFARVDPKHKVKILEALKAKRHIVGMTGDGVNDAPALKKADIGVAMGITGTDVSKEASDMVLTDDNFKSIVNAIEEGRRIFDNIRKFVMYLLSSNVGEVMVVFFGIMLGNLPLLALQILWINIATDGLPALALSVEPAEKDIMKRKPKKKQERILTKKRFYVLFGVGVIMMLGTLGVFKFYPSESIVHARTMAFTTLVMFQLFNVLNLQSESKSVIKTFYKNLWLLGAIASSVVLHLIILYVPFFNEIFETMPLSLFDWIWVICVAASVLVAGEIFKLILYFKNK